MLRLSSALIVMLTVACACGCAQAPVTDSRLWLAPSLGQWLEVSGHRARRHGELLDVRFTGISHASKPRRIQYKVEWSDSAGYEPNTLLDRWEMKSLRPAEPFQIQAIAPNPDIVDYRIKLRPY